MKKEEEEERRTKSKEEEKGRTDDAAALPESLLGGRHSTRPLVNVRNGPLSG